MEIRTDFVKWLSKKLYLATIGFYSTIGVIMILPVFFAKTFGFHPLIASFIAVFIVAFLRAAYETLIIYEAPVKHLSLPKMAILSFVTASVVSVASYFLKSLGYFKIPVSIIMSLMFVSKLKAALWPAVARQGFFAKLPEKLNKMGYGRYIFFVFLVGIAYFGYGKFGFSFPIVFAIAYFVGMIFEEYYNLVKLYEFKFTVKSAIRLLCLSAIFGTISSIIVLFMMMKLGYPGPVATITSVVLLKLLQPFCFDKFVLGLYEN